MLWAYMTTKCVPTCEISFLLVFKTKAIISIDISMPTLRVEGVDSEGVDQDQNDARLRMTLDQSKEK